MTKAKDQFARIDDVAKIDDLRRALDVAPFACEAKVRKEIEDATVASGRRHRPVIVKRREFGWVPCFDVASTLWPAIDGPLNRGLPTFSPVTFTDSQPE